MKPYIFLFLLSLLLSLGCAGGGEDAPKYRRVLILTVDTLRADHLSLEASNLPTTPKLDELLLGGVRFTRAVTPVPRTTQALASLFTGFYPHTTQVRSLLDSLSPEVIPLAEIARKNGYSTMAVVSNHILTPERGLDRGFDVYDFAPDIRIAPATTQAAIQRLREVRRDDPLFLWVHYIDPHVPYYPPPRLAEEFDPSYEGRYKYHFGEVQGGTGDRAFPKDLTKREAVYENRLPPQVNEHVRRLYAADIRAVDNNIHRLISWLEENLGDDWIIVFASDHGESLGEHDFFFDHGDYVYNASLRVPLAFVFPDGHPLNRSAVVDDWVSLVDVTPTLVELLELRVPEDLENKFEGRSLVPHLRGGPVSGRPLFAECGNSFFPDMIKRRVRFDVSGRFRAVIFDNWKLIWTPYQEGDLEYELYNLENDPHETRNLHDSAHPAVGKLKKMLQSWMRYEEAVESGKTIPEEELERLRALGYIDD